MPSPQDTAIDLQGRNYSQIAPSAARVEDRYFGRSPYRVADRPELGLNGLMGNMPALAVRRINVGRSLVRVLCLVCRRVRESLLLVLVEQL